MVPHLFIGMPETIDIGRAEREDGIAAKDIFADLLDQRPAARAFIDRGDVFGPSCQARREMIAQIGPDSGKMVPAIHPGAGQHADVTDAGQLQQMRRVDDPARDQHLAPCRQLDIDAQASAAAIDNTGGGPVLDQDPCDVGLRDDMKIGPVPDRMKKGAGGADTSPLPRRSLDVGDALLRPSVIILIQRYPMIKAGPDKGVAKRVTPCQIMNLMFAGASPEGIVTGTDPGFQSHEIGQHIGI